MLGKNLIFFLLTLQILFSIKTADANFVEIAESFIECKFENLYLDIQTKKTIHPYFEVNKLTPFKIDKDLAYFLIEEDFFGIPVYMIAIPASTFDIHALYMNIPIENARKKMIQKFDCDFTKSFLSDHGERPVLIVDPRDKNKSIIMCNPRIE